MWRKTVDDIPPKMDKKAVLSIGLSNNQESNEQ